jgi:hypothetical protein
VEKNFFVEKKGNGKGQRKRATENGNGSSPVYGTTGLFLRFFVILSVHLISRIET